MAVWPNSITRQHGFIWQREQLFNDISLRASYVLLHQLDLILTMFGTGMGAAELNPVMRSMLGMPLQLAVIKFAIPLLIALLIPGRLLLPAIAFLGLVVGWNLKEAIFLLF